MSIVAEHILASAWRAGVAHLWMTTGSDLTSFQEAASRLRRDGVPAPRILTAPHEHVGLSAAIGETMWDGRPSMTAVHADLGVLHQGGAIHNALLGRSPVLTLSGYPPVSEAQRRHPVYWFQQRWDPGMTVRQYSRWDYRLSSLDDPSVVTERALQVALSQPTGPVHLIVPDEVARQERPDDELARHLARRPLAPGRLGTPPEDACDLLAEKILAAELPLIVTDRAGTDPSSVAVLAALAEDFGIPVIAGRNRLNLPDGHTALVAPSALVEADCVILLESPVPWIPGRGGPAHGVWTAALGVDPLVRDVPVWEFPVDLALQVDVVATLRALHEALALRSGGHRERRAAAAARLRRAAERHPSPTTAEGRSPVLTEGDIAHALSDLLEPEDLLVTEVFDTSAVRREVPGTLFEKGASSLGWAQAAGVGLRVAADDRPTTCVTGDGSYIFGSPTAVLWAQQQLDRPVLTIVMANGGYRTGSTTLAAHYPEGAAVSEGAYDGGLLEPAPRLAAQAEAGGGHGAVITSRASLRDELRRARERVERDRVPAVVEVVVEPHRDRLPSAGDQRRRAAD
jgi:acetolactate synthase-1/2/3 large subunit